MTALTLEIVEGPDAGMRVALASALQIGRDPSADVRLDDELASRHHATIRAEPDGAVIEDLGSSNGTFVNDVEILEPTLVTAGDKLLIGSSVIELRAVPAPPPPAPPPPAPPAPAASPPAPPAPAPAAPPPATPPLAAPGPVVPAAPPLVARPSSAGAPDEAEETLPVGGDPRIGTELAGYLIEAVVGRGGMGVVYRAEHLRLKRKVALKLLPPELASNEGFRERFECESQLAAAIDHPNIIPLYDAGRADELLFLTMRFVDGLDLKALLTQEGPLPLERAVSIVAQIGGALDAAHARGLVHRDVKPANVLVASGAGPEASDHCYLTDFGLTKDTSSSLNLTGTGQFVGTIDYVAPEQIQGDKPKGAADQYALGCVMYEALTGHPPFERATELDVMWAHLNEDPPPPSTRRSDLPRGIDAVLARAMAKVPAERHESCTAMASAARATMEGRWRRRSR